MKKSSFNIVETHLEKGLVVAAVGFLGFMGWKYGLSTPNKVDVPGASEKVTAGELGPKILEEASKLEAALRNPPRPEDTKVERIAERLRDLQTKPIFASAAAPAPAASGDKPALLPPPLKPALRVSTSAGKEITVPGLQEIEEPPASVSLVTPLAPSDLAVKTGRNSVVQKQVKLGAKTTVEPSAAAAPSKDAAKDGSREISWVTVAGWFDKGGQQQEMTRNQYAQYRAKAYVAGVEVERQEVLASGDWSDWKVVDSSKAMPQFNTPTPAFKPDGSVLNRSEIDEGFQIVKSEQASLMQPRFFQTTAGDDWQQPTLSGGESTDTGEDAAAKAEDDRRARREKILADREQEKQNRQNRAGGGGGRPGGNPRGGGGRPGGGGGVSSDSVDSGRAPRAPINNASAREEGKKAVRDAMKEAKDAAAKKEWSTVVGHAQTVENSQHATPSEKKQAASMREDAEKKLASAGPGGHGGGPRTRMAADSGGPSVIESDFAPVNRRGASTVAPAAPSATAAQLVTHPENDKKQAVWFHDDSVEPGKTYRYRMRVKLWNRYLGRIKPLAEPEGAKQAVLVGDWSIPSEPVTVTPATYFFAAGEKGSGAMVEVFKWRDGKWVRRMYEVNVGDSIGKSEKGIKIGEDKADIDFTTGAVVLDIRHNDPVKVRRSGKTGYQFSDQKSLTIVYLDPADNQVKERSLAMDNTDPLKKQLRTESGG